MSEPTGPVNPPPSTEPQPTPPPQPAAPPAPPAPPVNNSNDGGVFTSLQQSVDALPETFINGMKEAFPVLSQPPAPPAPDPSANAGGAGTQTEGPQPSKLAKFWFGK
jgi:hypothetical protein